jgi:hypothetical protein
MYKIIAKILANRIKDVVPGLVDVQQKQFVRGRSIHNIILAHKIGQEYIKVTNRRPFYIKFDFIKAYDKVDRSFMFETLKEMGFNNCFTNLVAGLVEQGHGKVHFDRLFKETFDLKRGVRQGCLLAPLLFALTTQALMGLLSISEQKGDLEGISMPGGQLLLHQLFADDMGLFLKLQTGKLY